MNKPTHSSETISVEGAKKRSAKHSLKDVLVTFSKGLNNRISRQTKIAVAVIIGGIFCSGLVVVTAPKPLPDAITEKTRNISTMDVQLTHISPELSLFGRVSTPRRAQLSAAIGAEVLGVLVSEGQKVSAGELLVQLDDRDIQLDILQRQADLIDAKAQLALLQSRHSTDIKTLSHQRELYKISVAKLNRYRQLKEDNMISQALMDEAESLAKQQAITLERQHNAVDNYTHDLAMGQAQIKRSNAKLQLAQLNLDRTQIRAPFDALVGTVAVAPGDRVNTGRQIIALIDTAFMEVRAVIASRYAPMLKESLSKGIKVTARVAINNRRVELELKQITAEISSGLSGVEGIFHIVDKNTVLALGSVVNLTVNLPYLGDVVAVPVQSVYNNDRIFLVEEQRLRSIAVNVVGERLNDDGKLELLIRSNNLHDGQQLMTSALSMAITGLKVKALEKQISATSNISGGET